MSKIILFLNSLVNYHEKAFLSTIEDALKQSRVTIKGYYRQRIIVESKADASPVTEADRMVESQIRHIISQRHPDHSIIGEEHGTHHNLADYTWVIDPLMGLKFYFRYANLWYLNWYHSPPTAQDWGH